MENIKHTDFEESFAQGLEEIIAHKNGSKPLAVTKLPVPSVNLREIRSQLDNISQPEFAEKFGIPLASLRNWEQGRREPDQPTSILLYLISKFPDQISSEIKKLKAH